MSGFGLRLRDVAQPVARRLRDKWLILLELRDFAEIAHACACARGAFENTNSPMNFHGSRATQAISMTYRATHAQPSRNQPISRATKRFGGVVMGLKDEMPEVAAWVQELREALGAPIVDAALRKAKAGRGGFYAAEVGPDGVLREFGAPLAGGRAQLVDGALVRPGSDGAKR